MADGTRGGAAATGLQVGGTHMPAGPGLQKMALEGTGAPLDETQLRQRSKENTETDV